jgi:hypothetical protein
MSDDASLPEWWQRARRLEAQDKLDEAEAVIRDGVPNLYFAHATADLYRKRMIRKIGEGDSAGAREAFDKSEHFIWFMASLATSGGEGAALSDERDKFMEELVRDYGSDPR